MANCHSIAIALPIFFAVAAAHAADSNPITDANNEIAFSVGSHNIAYHEMFDQAYRGAYGSSLPHYPDSATGSQPTVNVGISRQWDLTKATGFYESATLTAAIGKADYDGYSIEDLSKGDFSRTLKYQERGGTLNLDLKMGPAFQPLSTLQFTPFVAYDFHLWRQDAYITRWQHAISLGLMTQYAFSRKLVLGGSVSVGRTFGVRTYDSEGGDDNTFKQGGKFTSTASVSLDYAFTQHTHLIASYQVARYTYGQSDSLLGTWNVLGSDTRVSGNLAEPPSKLTEQTLMIGVAYCF